jgi:hypothetical protein
MRKQKAVTLTVVLPDTDPPETASKEFIVYELTAMQVKGLLDNPNLTSEGEPATFAQKLQEWLPSCTTLKLEDVDRYSLAFSDLELLWEAFKEVNSSFFGLLKKSGLLDALSEEVQAELQREVRSALVGQSVSSLREVTDKQEITGGPGSSTL